MRRTRHVVLPVRSWEHVGLMVVSLACLTLGLVSRDREGQAGSLAGPDLQHCAPHKVDACPNENVFTRLLFYDDLATSSGLIPAEKREEHRTTESENADISENREVRYNRDNRERISTRRAAAVKVSRSESERSAERRDLRLSERRDDRLSRKTRDSRSAERDNAVRNYRGSSERRNTHFADRRDEQRSQRNSADRNSRYLAERTSERRNDGLRYSERDSAGQKFRLTDERREARLSERRNDRRSELTLARSLKRESLSRNTRTLNERSTERRDSRISERREERDFSARNLRRDDREIRGVRSSERASVARNSLLTSERRDRNARSFDRDASLTRNSEIMADRRSIERNFPATNTRRMSERREDRLTMSRRIRELRSFDRDSTARNSRNVAERREVRLSERRDDQRMQRARLNPIPNRNAELKISRSAADRETERRDARLSVRRDDRQESREVRDARSYQRNNGVRNSRDVRSLERDSATRSLHLVAELRDDRLSRKNRDLRSLDRDSATRNSRIAAERRDVRLSERRDDQRTRITPILNRNSVLRSSRLAADRASERRDVRLSERRGDRRDARFYQRDIRALERDSATGNSLRFVAERRDDRSNRQARDSNTLKADSRTRNFEPTGERGDRRLSERRVELQSRRLREARSIQRISGRNLYSTTERRENRVNDQIRNAKSLERDIAVRNDRSVAELRLVREARSLGSVERDSATRSSLINSERASMNYLRNVRNIRKQMRTAERLLNARYNPERLVSGRRSMIKGSTGEDRVDRSSRLRQTTERRQSVLQVRENSFKNERLGVKREQEGEKTQDRKRDSRSATVDKNQDVRAYGRTRGTKVPVSLEIRQERNYEARYKLSAQGTRLISTNILGEPLLPLSTTYEGLRQTAVLILCAIYGASLYGGKGSISRNIVAFANRFVLW